MKLKTEFKNELRILWIAAVALFVSIAFIATVVILFFFRSIELPEETVRTAAPKTFLVVLIMILVVIAAYVLSRYFTVVRPMKKINAFLERIAAGDFSQRLSMEASYGNYASLAENLNLMADELASSALLKTDFISNVSHELKTPLSVINNYGSLLKAPEIDTLTRQEYAQTITAASRRMSELITNILRLNRLENQQQEAAHEPIDLSTQLGDCLLQFETIWEDRSIDLDLELSENVIVHSDGELLEIVWNNLLSNAFKFTEPGGTVGVRVTREDAFAAVEISDTGCGMDADTGKHIFEKFYQGDTSHATQGNGLGLALVKRVIDLIGGEISVSSTLGEGSTFKVRIPL